MKALAPGFLIAAPNLREENFRQAVVLLLRGDEEGAMGVVINRESPLLLRELCSDHDIPYAGDTTKLVRSGGPVQPEQGLVLYGAEHRDPEGQVVLDALHVSASRGTLARLCSLESGRFQCYSGYAGWGPGQLEREIAQGTWIVSEADPLVVLESPPAEAWRRVLRAMGIDPAALVPGEPGLA